MSKVRLSGNAFKTDGPKTPDIQTSCDGTVERSVFVEQQIAGTDIQ